VQVAPQANKTEVRVIPESRVVLDQSGKAAGIYIPYHQAGSEHAGKYAEKSLKAMLQTSSVPLRLGHSIPGLRTRFGADLGLERYRSLADVRSDSYRTPIITPRNRKEKASIDKLALSGNALVGKVRTAQVELMEVTGSLLTIRHASIDQRGAGPSIAQAQQLAANNIDELALDDWRNMLAGKDINLEDQAAMIWNAFEFDLFVKYQDAPLAHAAREVYERFMAGPGEVVLVSTRQFPTGHQAGIPTFKSRPRLSQPGVILMPYGKFPDDMAKDLYEVDLAQAHALARGRKPDIEELRFRFKQLHAKGTVEILPGKDLEQNVRNTLGVSDDEFVCTTHNGVTGNFYTINSLGDYLTREESKRFAPDLPSKEEEADWNLPALSAMAYKFGLYARAPLPFTGGSKQTVEGPHIPVWTDASDPSEPVHESSIPASAAEGKAHAAA
jgi:hypothetical protein